MLVAARVVRQHRRAATGGGTPNEISRGLHTHPQGLRDDPMTRSAQVALIVTPRKPTHGIYAKVVYS
jgi:hypothetical protein